jgi:CRISPR/Cas system CSM-associated protein Csm4 (group 5 of RAMP superfamily)
MVNKDITVLDLQQENLRKLVNLLFVENQKTLTQFPESKIMKEYRELKSKNEEYKKALNIFKDKLNEVALFNTNLAYVNRLFTEHSTTKKEKMEILKKI